MIQKNIKGFYASWFGRDLIYMATDADAAQWILSLREDYVEKVSFATLPSLKMLSEGNIVAANGEAWRRQRQVYNPAFSKSAYMNYFNHFNTTVDKCMAILHNSKREDIDLLPIFSKFTLDVLGLTIFGHDFKSLEGQLEEYYLAYKNVFHFTPSRLLLITFPWLDNRFSPYSWNLRASVTKLNELFNKVVEEHNKNPTNDMLTHLLEASKGRSNVTLSEQELRANIFILFLAGHETTASALSWTLLELAQNPSVQQKMAEEVHTVLGDKSPSFEDLDKLIYIDNVIKESMRMHPPVAILPGKKLTQDVTYKDTFIPKDTILGINIFNIHHHPSYWTDPFKFNPDRWSVDKIPVHRYAYLPFSLGSRMCIGNNFSLIEQRLFLAKLVREFDICMPSKHTFSMKRGSGIHNPETVWVQLKPHTRC
eukprot:TRINITY_DN1655_c0_g2_i1.p1 TRINITY_DN1655_c0_g2~~TRINITY_DN1655_c0_g2_i1.p1  ORF type:complete len:449 (+),score=50.59 TRINITY_DN1655_c0_g2_i1:77-1348(+)